MRTRRSAVAQRGQLVPIEYRSAHGRFHLPLTEWCSAMAQNSPNHVFRFDQDPSTRAERLRKEARGTPTGVRRDELLRRARQIEGLSSVREPPASPDLQWFK